jgi:hypothetical protein
VAGLAFAISPLEVRTFGMTALSALEIMIMMEMIEADRNQ